MSFMCGIVGIQLKNPALEGRLGTFLVPMLESLTSRGPDSAGVALYDRSVPAGQLRYSLRVPVADFDWPALATAVSDHTGAPAEVETRANVALLTSPAGEAVVRATLATVAPEVVVVGSGHAMTIYKDVGTPRQICDRYGIGEAVGYQAVGHTRMATESAVTTEHSHPFNPVPDLTLVHNGSFSNHASIRRMLQDTGIKFDTDNDTEVAARFVGYRLGLGDDLAESMRQVSKEFDGFFTLLVATEREFAVVRDPFACKPLVVADCDDYVAVASEYHALADLPGILQARVFEPMPEEVHSWTL
jgi:amidophosphoribosyltransferase